MSWLGGNLADAGLLLQSHQQLFLAGLAVVVVPPLRLRAYVSASLPSERKTAAKADLWV